LILILFVIFGGVEAGWIGTAEAFKQEGFAVAPSMVRGYQYR
jgi:hypothetical protein